MDRDDKKDPTRGVKMNKVLKVKCPNCDKKFEYSLSEFRPFCCERCQLIDLGQWLNGSYTLESNDNLSDEDLERVIKEKTEESEE
jgi:uncharacterized protein